MKAQAMRHILLVDDHAAVRHELVLVDLSLGDDDALRLVAELCARDIPVLVCSTHDEPGYVRRALTAGARGYITKREARRTSSI
jgi:two-component system, NarL family, invasion response regulator UvrY